MKIGDRVSFKGRQGTVTAFMPQNMVDVQFDDVGHVERRASGDLSVMAKTNPGANPFAGYARASRKPRKSRRQPQRSVSRRNSKKLTVETEAIADKILSGIQNALTLQNQILGELGSAPRDTLRFKLFETKTRELDPKFKKEFSNISEDELRSFLSRPDIRSSLSDYHRYIDLIDAERPKLEHNIEELAGKQLEFNEWLNQENLEKLGITDKIVAARLALSGIRTAGVSFTPVESGKVTKLEKPRSTYKPKELVTREPAPFLEQKIRKEKVAFFTRHDPLRMADEFSFCGNPIDSTAYYIVANAQAQRSYRYLTWEDSEKVIQLPSGKVSSRVFRRGVREILKNELNLDVAYSRLDDDEAVSPSVIWPIPALHYLSLSAGYDVDPVDIVRKLIDRGHTLTSVQVYTKIPVEKLRTLFPQEFGGTAAQRRSGQRTTRTETFPVSSLPEDILNAEERVRLQDMYNELITVDDQAVASAQSELESILQFRDRIAELSIDEKSKGSDQRDARIARVLAGLKKTKPGQALYGEATAYAAGVYKFAKSAQRDWLRASKKEVSDFLRQLEQVADLTQRFEQSANDAGIEIQKFAPIFDLLDESYRSIPLRVLKIATKDFQDEAMAKTQRRESLGDRRKVPYLPAPLAQSDLQTLLRFATEPYGEKSVFPVTQLDPRLDPERRGRAMDADPVRDFYIIQDGQYVFFKAVMEVNPAFAFVDMMNPYAFREYKNPVRAPLRDALVAASKIGAVGGRTFTFQMMENVSDELIRSGCVTVIPPKGAGRGRAELVTDPEQIVGPNTILRIYSRDKSFNPFFTWQIERHPESILDVTEPQDAATAPCVGTENNVRLRYARNIINALYGVRSALSKIRGVTLNAVAGEGGKSTGSRDQFEDVSREFLGSLEFLASILYELNDQVMSPDSVEHQAAKEVLSLYQTLVKKYHLEPIDALVSESDLGQIAYKISSVIDSSRVPEDYRSRQLGYTKRKKRRKRGADQGAKVETTLGYLVVHGGPVTRIRGVPRKTFPSALYLPKNFWPKTGKTINQGSIGAVLGTNDKGQLVISSLSPESAAQTAGLRVGDMVVAIDGNPMEGVRANEANSRLAGDGRVGSYVALRINRSGQIFDLRLQRQPIENPYPSVAGSALRFLASMALDPVQTYGLAPKLEEGQLRANLRDVDFPLKGVIPFVSSSFTPEGQMPSDAVTAAQDYLFTVFKQGSNLPMYTQLLLDRTLKGSDNLPVRETWFSWVTGELDPVTNRVRTPGKSLEPRQQALLMLDFFGKIASGDPEAYKNGLVERILSALESKNALDLNWFRDFAVNRQKGVPPQAAQAKTAGLSGVSNIPNAPGFQLELPNRWWRNENDPRIVNPVESRVEEDDRQYTYRAENRQAVNTQLDENSIIYKILTSAIAEYDQAREEELRKEIGLKWFRILVLVELYYQMNGYSLLGPVGRLDYFKGQAENAKLQGLPTRKDYEEILTGDLSRALDEIRDYTRRIYLGSSITEQLDQLKTWEDQAYRNRINRGDPSEKPVTSDELMVVSGLPRVDVDRLLKLRENNLRASIKRAGRVIIFKTYNPVLFELSRALYGDAVEGTNMMFYGSVPNGKYHIPYINCIDIAGRYGVLLKLAYEACIAYGANPQSDSLEAYVTSQIQNGYNEGIENINFTLRGLEVPGVIQWNTRIRPVQPFDYYRAFPLLWPLGYDPEQAWAYYRQLMTPGQDSGVLYSLTELREQFETVVRGVAGIKVRNRVSVDRTNLETLLQYMEDVREKSLQEIEDAARIRKRLRQRAPISANVLPERDENPERMLFFYMLSRLDPKVRYTLRDGSDIDRTERWESEKAALRRLNRDPETNELGPPVYSFQVVERLRNQEESMYKPAPLRGRMVPFYGPPEDDLKQIYAKSTWRRFEEQTKQTTREQDLLNRASAALSAYIEMPQEQYEDEEGLPVAQPVSDMSDLRGTDQPADLEQEEADLTEVPAARDNPFVPAMYRNPFREKMYR